MARQDDHVRYTLRIPRAIYDRITALPDEGSINAKIVNALDAAGSRRTLRDEFAMAALIGIMSSTRQTFTSAFVPWADYASEAFKLADAMLAERQKP